MSMQRRSKPPFGAFLRTGNRARGPAAGADRQSGHIQPLCLSRPGTFLIAGHLCLQLHGPRAKPVIPTVRDDSCGERQYR